MQEIDVDVSRFDGIQVLDIDGRPLTLAAPLRGHPSVVVFLRHFG